jgi:hypothetical protein
MGVTKWRGVSSAIHAAITSGSASGSASDRDMSAPASGSQYGSPIKASRWNVGVACCFAFGNSDTNVGPVRERGRLGLDDLGVWSSPTHHVAPLLDDALARAVVRRGSRSARGEPEGLEHRERGGAVDGCRVAA